MSNPTISVVMPVYNAERYVAYAIDSILGQTLGDFEFIIVDDASTDGSVDVIASYNDSRIRLLRHNVNGGYPVAMQTGLTQCRGTYFARMDADDWSAPQRFAVERDFLEAHPDAAFVGSRRFWITPGLKTWSDGKRYDAAFIEETWRTVHAGTREFADASVMSRMDLVRQAGGYRTYQRTGQDVDLWLRLLELRDRGVTLTQYLYGRRLVPGAITFAQRTTAVNQVPRVLAIQRRETGRDAVMDGLGIDGLIPSGIGSESDRWRIRAMWGAAVICLSAGDREGMWAFAAAAAKASPFSKLGMKQAAKFAIAATRHAWSGGAPASEVLPALAKAAGGRS